LERKGEKLLHPRATAAVDVAQEVRQQVRHHRDTTRGRGDDTGDMGARKKRVRHVRVKERE
jgi:hypothetical protein